MKENKQTLIKQKKLKKKKKLKKAEREAQEKQFERVNKRIEKEDDYKKSKDLSKKYHSFLDRDEENRQRKELEALKTAHKYPDKYFRARSNTLNGQIHQDSYPDSITKYIQKHPDQFKESGIFESVSFLND